MEIRLSTFVETTPDVQTGEVTSHAQRIREVVEEIVLGDQVGLDVFGVGEHHRKDYAASSPAVVLAAAARSFEGALYVGDPETVAEKIIHLRKHVGITRFMLHTPVGSMPHEDVMNAIELLGTEVAPRVREEISNWEKEL
ncbi:LLM class flavin-dependent oxidoreductase [Neobacillus cucumis]|uniref:LLM class flavin-dependent oxidoreductase n=1 Tax=Neobacillus cucumis TaxID=1740721 RepID=UPI0018DF6770|nr:LLM class flavin-dependent oxidoreductase [Neobacillus cucumis]MBI0578238.1 LLM class flavin-dependent oxidoreductase [Neobacillus cucumis]